MDNIEDEVVVRVCSDGERVSSSLFDEGDQLVLFAWLQTATGELRAERWNIDVPHTERVVLRTFGASERMTLGLSRSACRSFVMFSFGREGFLFSGAREPRSRLVNATRGSIRWDGTGGRLSIAVDADRLALLRRRELAIVTMNGRRLDSIPLREKVNSCLSVLGKMKLAIGEFDSRLVAQHTAVDLETRAVIALGDAPSDECWLLDDRVYVLHREPNPNSTLESFGFDGSATRSSATNIGYISTIVGGSLFCINELGMQEHDATTLALVSETTVDPGIDQLWCDEAGRVVVTRRGETLELYSATTAERLLQHAPFPVSTIVIGLCDGGSTLLAWEPHRARPGAVVLVEFALSSGAIERRWESDPIDLDQLYLASTQLLGDDRTMLLTLEFPTFDPTLPGYRWLIVRRMSDAVPLEEGWRLRDDGLMTWAIDGQHETNAILVRPNHPAVWCAIETLSSLAPDEAPPDDPAALAWRRLEWLADGTMRTRPIATLPRGNGGGYYLVEAGARRYGYSDSTLVRRDGTSGRLTMPPQDSTLNCRDCSCNGRLKLEALAINQHELFVYHFDGTLVCNLTFDDPLDGPAAVATNDDCSTLVVATSRGRLLVYSCADDATHESA